MSYISLSLLAALLFSASIIVNKFISKHRIDNSDSFFVLFVILAFIPALIVPFIPGVNLKLPPFPIFLGYPLFFTAGAYLFVKGIYTVDASVVGPIFQVQSGLIVILAAIFLGEKFPLLSYFWMTLLILGAVLVSVNEKMKLSSFFRTGILFLLGMQLFHAIANLFVGFALQETNFWSVSFFGALVNFSLVLVFYLIKRPKINYPFKTTGLIFLGRLLSFTGATALFAAFQHNLSISSVLGLLTGPIVFIISLIASKWFPKLLEHHSGKVYAVRALGVLIILVAAIKLTLSQ